MAKLSKAVPAQDLFGDLPPTVSKAMASSRLKVRTAGVSPEQKKFNSLIAKIEKEEARLAQLLALQERFRPQFAAKLLPLEARARANEVAMIHAIDQALGGKGFTKTERATMVDILTQLAMRCALNLRSAGADREADAMTVIFDRWSERSFASLAGEGEAMTREMMESMGIELGDDFDLSNPHAAAAQAQAAFNARDEALAAQWEAERNRAQPKRVSAKEAERVAHLEKEQEDAHQALRGIYRKLAALLHPDREPDEAERARKSDLMARANKAYEARDLLALLQLQMSVEQIDTQSVSALASEKLAAFNRSLQDRAGELIEERSSLEAAMAAEFGITPGYPISEMALESALIVRVRDFKADLADMDEDLAAIQEKPRLKQWLREQVRLMAERDSDFGLDDELLDQLGGQFDPEMLAQALAAMRAGFDPDVREPGTSGRRRAPGKKKARRKK